MSQEVKNSYKYFLHKIIKELEENAEIKFYGCTYSSDEDHIPVKSLIQGILDDAGGDASEIIRKLTLSNEIAADGNITDSKKKLSMNSKFTLMRLLKAIQLLVKMTSILKKKDKLG